MDGSLGRRDQLHDVAVRVGQLGGLAGRGERHPHVLARFSLE
jgi:hypothetical protein